MNEEATQEQTAQEVVPAAQTQEAAQVAQPQGKGEETQTPDPVRELEELRKELKRVREEAASRRVEKKTLEERIQEMESAMAALRERVALEAARAELVAALGDKTAAEAALKLARADGLVQVEGEGARVDLETLFSRYPFLRTRGAPRDAGANPPATPQLTRDAIAQMTPEEYAKRRREILEALAKGLIK